MLPLVHAHTQHSRPSIIGVLNEFFQHRNTGWVMRENFSNSNGEVDLLAAQKRCIREKAQSGGACAREPSHPKSSPKSESISNTNAAFYSYHHPSNKPPFPTHSSTIIAHAHAIAASQTTTSASSACDEIIARPGRREVTMTERGVGGNFALWFCGNQPQKGVGDCDCGEITAKTSSK